MSDLPVVPEWEHLRGENAGFRAIAIEIHALCNQIAFSLEKLSDELTTEIHSIHECNAHGMHAEMHCQSCRCEHCEAQS